MTFRSTMLAFAALFALVSEVHGEGVALRGGSEDKVPRKDELRASGEDAATRSCSNGVTIHLKPPWEDMDSHAQGASTVQSCEECAQSLEKNGYLISGWKCYSWWGRMYLNRPKDSALTEIKPLRSFALADVEGAGPLMPGTSPLPEALRGVFWLSEQKTQSALITFAPNNEADCKWCSYGKLILNRYLVRVTGDRVWSWAAEDSAGYDAASSLKLVYDFSFDSAANPAYATIYPVPESLGGFGTRLSKQTWLLTFDMTLLSSVEAEALGYPGSVVWERRSYAGGIEIKSKRYHVVQVVDEKGKRIEAAWKKFNAYQNSEDAGGEPGVLFYHGDK